MLNEKGGVEADVTVSILDGGSGQLHEPIFKVKHTNLANPANVVLPYKLFLKYVLWVEV